MRKNALEHDAPARTWILAWARHAVATLPFWIGAFAASLAISVVVFGTLPGDVEASRAVQGIGWTWLPAVMEFGDSAGSKVWLFPLLGTTVIGLIAFRRWKEATVLGLAGSFYVFSPLLKQAIARPRPDLEGIQVLVNPVGYSFPSGHAMGSGLIIGGTVVVALLLLKGRRWAKALAVATGLSLLFVIGSSRIYLGAHWASDVIAGYALAGMFLLIALRLAQRRFAPADSAA